jgi:hypothetical protein
VEEEAFAHMLTDEDVAQVIIYSPQATRWNWSQR